MGINSQTGRLLLLWLLRDGGLVLLTQSADERITDIEIGELSTLNRRQTQRFPTR